MSKHLTLEDRVLIRDRLNKRVSLRQIAVELGRHPSTISNEIKGHLKYRRTGSVVSCFNDCRHRIGCDYLRLCRDTCTRSRCCTCPHCREFCPDYEQQICERLQTSPYVCNGCPERKKCTLEKRVYNARYAQDEYEVTLSEQRSGFRLSADELQRADEILSPLIKNGQSPYAACQSVKDALNFSVRTVYRLIRYKMISAELMDLPRTVQRKLKPRTKRHNYKVDRKCLENRRYEDYLAYRETAMPFPTVEMDTVIGRIGGKALLTLHFKEAHFMAAFLLDSLNARNVSEVFNRLYIDLSHQTFAQLFPAVLTDNGTEFSNPTALEFWRPGTTVEARRTRIFYCHPRASFEKPHCENNHALIRRILPKGTSFDDLTPRDVDLVMSHINSYVRSRADGQTPYDLFRERIPGSRRALEVFGIHKVPAGEVILKPSLLKTNA